VVDHVAVIVMENRTTDQLLGGLRVPGAEVPGPPCPALAWPPSNTHAAAVARRGRRCAVPAAELPVTAALVRAGCVAVGHFSEVLGPSDPNHLALMAAASPVVDNLGWLPRLPPMATLADRLDQAGLSWRNYAGNCADGLAMLPHLRGRPEMRSWREFARDARRGQLARLSWLTAPYARSHHPPMPLLWGERWLCAQVAALAASPCWPALVTVIVWDDWGGYWDHLAPPVLERWRDGTPFRLGLRTPLLLVGGRVPPGTVYERPTSHASVPALVERAFGLPPLTGWDAEADDLGDALLPPGRPPAPAPRLPRLPPPSAWERAGARVIDAAAVAWTLAHAPRR
jgi:phospholipase C